ncbi:Calx-beta domain-containing protein, partial [Planctomycetota bacterium]
TISIDDIILAEGNAGPAVFGFTVSLSASSAQTITVDYTTTNGSATTADLDYTAVSNTLTFNPGDTTKPVTVNVAGDVKNEAHETFTVDLSNETGLDVSIADNQGLGTITNDDPMTISIDDITLVEGDVGSTAFGFTVSLAAASGQTITVDYTTTDGIATVADSDYTAVSNTLTFNPGDTTKPVTVNIAGDVTNEAHETFTIDLSNQTGAGVTITDNQGLGTITNDDTVTISIDDIVLAEGNAGPTAFGFTVSLAAATGQTITVDYTTTNGSATIADLDYTAVSGTVTFNPGDTTKPVTVNVTGDVKNEVHETFTVDLSNQTGVGVTIFDDQGLGTIANDDPIAISIDNITLPEGHAGPTVFVFTVSLSVSNWQTITVDYTTTDRTATVADNDYTAVAGTLTFEPGNTVKTITVIVNGDTEHEDHDNFTVDLSNETGTGVTIADAQGRGLIQNDDPPGIFIVEPGGSTQISEDGATDGYTVVLLSKPTSNVTVTATPDAQTDLDTGAETDIAILVFTPINWADPQTITVTANDDFVAEDVHSSTITHVAESDDSDYDAIGIIDVAATITDNDIAGISIIESDDVTDIAEGGATDTYNIVLTSQPVIDVFITAEPDDQSYLRSGPDPAITLTFTADDWNEPQTVVVTAVDDGLVEGLHLSIISHSADSGDDGYDGIEISEVVAVVTDNDFSQVIITETDGTTEVIEGGATDSYWVSLEALPTANVYVTVTPDMEISLDSGAGTAVTLTFTNLTWNIPQNVDITAVNDSIIEGLHTSTITHTVTSDDDSFNGGTVSDVIVQIRDDEFFADAGADRQDLPGLHQLNGSILGQMESGDLVFTWTQISGDPVPMNDPLAARAYFVASVSGDYSFEFTVEGSGGLTDTDSITITVLDTAPVAVTSPHFTMPLGTSAVLSGIDSYDSSGTAIDSYNWDMYEGDVENPIVNPVAFIDQVMVDPTSSTPDFTPPEAGVYHLSLQVSSDGQNSELARMEITVLDQVFPTEPPAANAGPFQVVSLNSIVTLNGRNSMDPDSGATGPDLAFSWRQISGPAVALSDSFSEAPTFTPVQAGFYTFGLTVTDVLDDNLPSNEDSTTVVAFAEAVNLPPTALPHLLNFDDTNLDGVINVGEKFTLSTDESVDPDGDPLSIQWSQVSGPGFYEMAPGELDSEIEYIPLTEGTYIFQLIVNDGTTDSPPVEITVQVLPADTSAPVAVAMANNQEVLRVTILDPTAIALDASLSTGDDGETADGLDFTWHQIQGPPVLIGAWETQAASVTLLPSIAQTYAFELTVSNATGAMASDTVYVAVSTYDPATNPGGNNIPRPQIDAPQHAFVGEKVKMNGSSSFDPQDADGVEDGDTGLILTWTQIGGPFVALDKNDPLIPTFTPAIPGIYRFLCYADDGIATSMPAEVMIEITKMTARRYGGGGGGGSSGCFIATAAYGSYAEKHVMLLREFRDRCLLTNTPGRWFVNTYYKYSPPVAGYIAKRPALQGITRITLLPLIALAMFTVNANLATKMLIICMLVLIARWITRRMHMRQAKKVQVTAWDNLD